MDGVLFFLGKLGRAPLLLSYHNPPGSTDLTTPLSVVAGATLQLADPHKIGCTCARAMRGDTRPSPPLPPPLTSISQVVRQVIHELNVQRAGQGRAKAADHDREILAVVAGRDVGAEALVVEVAEAGGQAGEQGLPCRIVARDRGRQHVGGHDDLQAPRLVSALSDSIDMQVSQGGSS